VGDDPNHDQDSPSLSQPQDRQLGGNSISQDAVGIDKGNSLRTPNLTLGTAPIDENVTLLPTQKPGFAQQIDPRPYLEVYLLKGDRDQILKMPFKQEVLRAQMDAVLARSEKSTWEVLVSLTAKDQADVNYVVETAKKKDNAERVLAAIEADISTTDLRHILLFLAVEADSRPMYTRMARRHLSLETLNQFRIPYELDVIRPITSHLYFHFC